MSYKCIECGYIFEEGEQRVWEESHGLDSPPYERFEGCPVCGNNFEETCKCKLCGEDFRPSELWNDVCDECIESYRYDVKIGYEIGKNDLKEIKINGLLASIFEPAAIEDILYKYLINNKKCDCIEFIDEDRDWFAKKLVEEVKKNENGKK